MDTTRRNLIALAGLAPFALLGLRSAQAADGAATCYNPATLPFTQKSRRNAIGFRETSADPKKHCSLCAFFTATQAGCGTCALLGAGPVTAGSVCTSFAPKA